MVLTLLLIATAPSVQNYLEISYIILVLKDYDFIHPHINCYLADAYR